MQVTKRDGTTGRILTMVDTDIFTDEERPTISDELHEFVIDGKTREAAEVTAQGIEAQVQYLVDRFGEDTATDILLGALEAVDKWKSWK